MILKKVVYSLISLSWFIGNPFYLLAQPANTPPITEEKPVRIAVMPFCDESIDVGEGAQPDPEMIFKYIVGALDGLYSCQKHVEWVSDRLINDSKAIFTSNSNQNPFTCGYFTSDSVCEKIDAGILVMGEFFVNEKGGFEVYYSYETCEGINTSEIEYQTPQPLRLKTDDLTAAYKEIGGAIQKDLQVYLSCEKGINALEINKVAKEGIDLFSQADENTLNYLKAVELFEKILQTRSNHEEALYYIGLSYFSLGEYDKAESYFARAGDVYDARTYFTYCQLESRPAIWYNSDKKRRDWWNDLSDQWKGIFKAHLWEIEGEENPDNEMLAKLFEHTELSFEGETIPNLKGLEALTNLTSLTLFKTELSSLKGIENLINLDLLSINKNEITSLAEIRQLPALTRLYCRHNPLENLDGIEGMDKSRSVILCGGSVPKKEMKKFKELGFEVLP